MTGSRALVPRPQQEDATTKGAGRRGRREEYAGADVITGCFGAAGGCCLGCVVRAVYSKSPSGLPGAPCVLPRRHVRVAQRNQIKQWFHM